MKTLKKDGINEKLLLETLAYIETHPQDWEQGSWRCGTGMCFAGHAALTLSDSTPIITVDSAMRRVLNKVFGLGKPLGPNEQKRWEFWGTHSDSLKPKRGEDAHRSVNPLSGKPFSYVPISERAENLLGHDAVFPSGGGNLFAGSNRLHQLRRHIAGVLEISLPELNRRLDEIIAEKRWKRPA